MRSIFIVLVLVGVAKGLSGVGITDENRFENPFIVASESSDLKTQPMFAELKGSLFLAVQTSNGLRLNDGAVVEFQFKKNGSVKSFHVNDANQDVLNQGEADLLVMVHEDLALALKSEKLMKVKITSGDEVTTLRINDYWPPHVYLTNL